jgi:hypothetical protein
MTEATQPTEQAEATIQEQWVKLHRVEDWSAGFRRKWQKK